MRCLVFFSQYMNAPELWKNLFSGTTNFPQGFVGGLPVAPKAGTTWKMLDVAMSHFQAHINAKKNRFSLSIVDLLYVRNFKGGYASITVPVRTLEKAIVYYETLLNQIGKK